MQSMSFAPAARKPTRPAFSSAARGPRHAPQAVPKLAPTPPLTRSLSSSPSSSTLPEDNALCEFAPEDLKIVYAAGLNSLDLDLDEVHDGPSPVKALSVCKKKLLVPRKVAFVPNPHAVPFIPTVVRKRHQIDPNTCALDVPPIWLPHRDWIRPMQSGAASAQSGVRRSYARKVVEAGPWDTAMMSELAGKMVELVAEGSERDTRVDTMECVAQFALQIYECFRQQLGEDAALTFRQLLKQCLLSEYRAWWLSTLSSAIANIPANSPSPPHAHPLRLLTCALGVADFVGATFAVGLTSGSYVKLCIDMLLERLSVLEELRAIHCIIFHTGDTLYECERMDDFLIDLKTRVDGLTETSSCVGEPDVRQKAQALLEDIERIVRSWAGLRTTPTLTEISDTVTEYSDYNPEFTVHRTSIATGAPLFQQASVLPPPPGLPPVPRDNFSRVPSARTVRPDDYSAPMVARPRGAQR